MSLALRGLPACRGRVLQQTPTHFLPLRTSTTIGLGRRTIFGVGDPITLASLQASKNLIYGVIAANAAVFISWRTADENVKGTDRMMKNFTVKRSDLKESRYYTFLTSAFSHYDFNHIFGNMFALYAFSSVLTASAVPPMALGALMVGSALSGSASYLYNERSKKYAPWQPETPALGASGMVMGLGAAAALLNPTAPMLLFGIVPTPMWALFAGYTLYDLYYLNNPMSRTGHAAHLGGGLFGAAFYALVLRRLGGVF